MSQQYQMPFKLLSLLRDGRFHSGTRLSEKLGISRVALWHHIQTLKKWGIVLHAVRGKGYQLQTTHEWLDPPAIQRHLSPVLQAWIQGIDLHLGIDSTNAALLSKTPPNKGALVCLSEMQWAGRGRIGRSWLTTLGEATAVSVTWQSKQPLKALSTMPLAIGVAVRRALALHAVTVGLKWPNDIWLHDAKLGGILLETKQIEKGKIQVVLGIGLNDTNADALSAQLDRPVASLSQAISTPWPRNHFISDLLTQLFEVYQAYETGQNFAPFLSTWNDADVLKGHRIQAKLMNNVTLSGIVMGITQTGLLRLDVNGVAHWLNEADVTRCQGNNDEPVAD